MYELTTAADRRCSAVHRRYGRARPASSPPAVGRRNVCLVTANHSLNGVSILNILNGLLVRRRQQNSGSAPGVRAAVR